MERELKSDVNFQSFGGTWTQTKLKILAKYLELYTGALKNQNFEKIYIDGFAGSGYVEVSNKNSKLKSAELPFPEFKKNERNLLDGSAKLAIQIEPRFDRYYFIERDKSHCIRLELLKSEFEDRCNDVSILQGEANEEIKKLCNSLEWDSSRAVLFLDPYGMQVEWKTIEIIARTKAIDMWLLFPLGIGVNRLLTKNFENLPKSWINRLNRLLGDESWQEDFYKPVKQQTLFVTEQKRVKAANMESISQYFERRLKNTFAGVAPSFVLFNSVRNPIYLMCFAVGNDSPKAKGLALKFANHVIKKM